MSLHPIRYAALAFTLAAGCLASAAEAAPSAIARCEQASHDLLDALGRGDYAAAQALFAPALAVELPAARLQAMWEDTAARQGALRTAGRPHGGRVNGRSEVFIPLMFEKSTVTADVVCGADGRIGAFRLTPPRTP
ncbi:MAG TPA: hypothetical protein VMR06_02905 [Dokdonella sp.]|uniref:hypothetical protein n=1 Tax=Dokdonella sp. TaxID=2291710 RepID=UPI002CBEDAC1|nr:hypothetical protein [Dokdonella sp.]HUD40927.1 hypothetical protein [Dokdonella sp.]